MIQYFDENVLPILLDWRRMDGAGALVTLVRKSASGPRPLGSQLAVSADGRVVGLISGGCVEGGIAEEAVMALREGRNRMARFGEGSRYVDLRMPCGGSIDVHVNATVATETLAEVAAGQVARRPLVMVTDLDEGAAWVEPPRPADDEDFAEAELTWEGEMRFRRLYRPPPRLVLVGRGPILPLAAHMAALNGYYVVVLTDDVHAADQAAPFCAEPPRGCGPGDLAAVPLDAATAVVTLFHDHDVELPVLRRALRAPVFHIGALGSKVTHAARLARLADEGFDEATLARIDGPAGVPIYAANPPEVSTSIVAGVIRAYRRRRPRVSEQVA